MNKVVALKRTKCLPIVLAIFVLLASSCLPEPQEPPMGIWKSEDPEIIMYLMPEYRNVPAVLPVPAAFYHLVSYHTDDSVQS